MEVGADQERYLALSVSEDVREVGLNQLHNLCVAKQGSGPRRGLELPNAVSGGKTADPCL